MLSLFCSLLYSALTAQLLVFRFCLVRFLRSLMGVCNLYFLRISQPECQFISVYKKLHRVSHRSVFYQCYFCSRYHSHIEEMLPERAFSAYLSDNGGLSYF